MNSVELDTIEKIRLFVLFMSKMIFKFSDFLQIIPVKYITYHHEEISALKPFTPLMSRVEKLFQNHLFKALETSIGAKDLLFPASSSKSR